MLLKYAESMLEDGPWTEGGMRSDSPVHDDDFDWVMAGEVYVQDTGILSLFDEALDGIDDLEPELNQHPHGGLSAVSMPNASEPGWSRSG